MVSRQIVWMLLVLAFCRPGLGEVFHLNNGGRIEGQFLNPDELQRKTYEIRTPGGIEITLDKSQVTKVERRRPEEIEYEKIWPQYPDTVEGQWELAEWCRKNVLHKHREKHLQRIIEIDPEHVKARRGLGYSQHDGEWKTQEEYMTGQGYVWHSGRWRLQQELDLMAEERQITAAESKWMVDLKVWRRWLGTNNTDLARENILKITDPFAIRGLAAALEDDPRDQARLLFLESLANIGNGAAMHHIAVSAMQDEVEEVRLTSLDLLKEAESRVAVDYFVSALRSKTNAEVNRAAACLRQMEEPSAIGPLIGGLVTVHKYKIDSRDPNQMSTTFGSGPGVSGGGMSMGGGLTVITRQIENRAVLDALITLSGVNFGFDVPRWKAWYAAQQRSGGFDSRRD